MGKYDPLAKHLKDLPRDEWKPSFEEIEDILGFQLPPSARRHRAWWGNSCRGNHSQAAGWIGAGWEIRDIDLRQEKVRLERTANAGKMDVGSDIQGLWSKARELSKITDANELERAVLECFIQRETAKALIALGGSDPHAKAPPRRRFW